MKDIVSETKQATARENIAYNFQPNDQLDAIKEAIVRKFNNKRKLSASSPSIESSSLHLQHHIGGLPSPPVEDKKVIDILPCNQPPPSPSLSSQEIREKIQLLKDEKHRLFQLIKQMMMEEESRKRQAKSENKKRALPPPPPPPPVQSSPTIPSVQQQQTKKKSRWGAPAVNAHPFYSSNSFYFHPRPTPPASRYNSSHPYSNQRLTQQHYPLSRPPYSR